MHSTSLYGLKLSVLRGMGAKALATDHRGKSLITTITESFSLKKSLVTKVPDCYKSAPLVTKVPHNVTKVPCCRYKSALVTLQKCPWLQKFPIPLQTCPLFVTKVPVLMAFSLSLSLSLYLSLDCRLRIFYLFSLCYFQTVNPKKV